MITVLAGLSLQIAGIAEADARSPSHQLPGSILGGSFDSFLPVTSPNARGDVKVGVWMPDYDIIRKGNTRDIQKARFRPPPPPCTAHLWPPSAGVAASWSSRAASSSPCAPSQMLAKLKIQSMSLYKKVETWEERLNDALSRRDTGAVAAAQKELSLARVSNRNHVLFWDFGGNWT